MSSPISSFYNWYKATLRNAKYRWVLVAATLIYLVSPIDISPDFLPVIGWVDDGILATLLVAELSQMALQFINKRKPSDRADVTVDPITTVEV